MNKEVLIVFKGAYPWDVRVQKIGRSLLNNGYNVTIAARWAGEAVQRESNDGFDIYRIGYGKPGWYSLPVSGNPAWSKGISKICSEKQISLIMPRDIMLAEAAGKIGRRKNIPVVMDMAEHYPAAMRGWKKYYDNRTLRLLVHTLDIPDIVEKRAVARMDGIIVVTEELRQRLSKTYSFNTENVEILTNVPEPDWFNDIKTGCANPPREFAYHGDMTPDRNLDLMVKAFAIAAGKNSNIRLTIAGDGETYDECRALAESSGVEDRIIFTGRYCHSDIKKLYSEMDIGIIPFKTNEFINHVIANKLFDYTAAGKPVIVSPAPPMVRFIEETESGIIADCSSPGPLADAILKMAETDVSQMSANGIKAFNDKYNWPAEETKLISFLERFS